MQKNTTHFSMQELEQQIMHDVQVCRTVPEQGCVRSFGGIEIRKKAYSLVKQRPLTEIELDIARKYGYKPR